MMHVALLVVQSIILGSLVTSWTYERPWRWWTWALAVLTVFSIGWYSFRVLEPHCRNVTILIFPPNPEGYVS